MSSIDTERLDEVVLALLWANAFESGALFRAWKSLDWETLDRLHAKGLIGNPRSQAKSVTLAPAAVERGQELFQKWFMRAEAAAFPAPAAAGGRLSTTNESVYEFTIRLLGIAPPIWRRIQVPGTATFWDLHCALNDAMGWEDAHLHEFRLGTRRNGESIGIPDPDFPERDVSAGWEVAIADRFGAGRKRCLYLYDFGDGWEHEVKLAQIVPREPKVRYPRCLDGARACPPEDCGGIPGYQDLIEALAHPQRKRSRELLEWLGDGFAPEAFDPSKVRFGNAQQRLKALLRQR